MKRWNIVWAGILILMCLGTAYAWGVFLPAIESDMGWSRAQIALAASVLLIVFSIFMPVGGLLEKRIGPRLTATLGGLLVGSGWAMASFADSPLGLYLYYGIMAGIGTGLSYMPSISTGIKWFPRKKGLVTGLIIFGFGFGAAFLSPVLTGLINSHGWRAAMLVCGLVFAAVITACSQLLKNPPTTVSNQSAQDSPTLAMSPGQMVRTGAFRLMFLTYFMSMTAGMMPVVHMVTFATDRGLSAMQGALGVTILSVFNGLGRILGGHAADRLGTKGTLTGLFGVMGAAMFVLPHAGGMLAGLYLLAAVIGLCFGGFLAVYPALSADYFGKQHFSVNYGLVFIGYGSGCFMGPVVAGKIHDMTQSYMIAFYVAGAVALAGAALIAGLLKAPEPKAS